MTDLKLPQIPFPSVLYNREGKKKSKRVLGLFLCPLQLFFSEYILLLTRTGHFVVIENHGRYIMFWSALREPIVPSSLGVPSLQSPFRTSQARAQIPESATQLEDSTIKFLTVPTHLTCHITKKNITLMPLININSNCFQRERGKKKITCSKAPAWNRCLLGGKCEN